MPPNTNATPVPDAVPHADRDTGPTSSGELHTSLTNTDAPTEVVRSDSLGAPAFAAAATPSTSGQLAVAEVITPQSQMALTEQARRDGPVSPEMPNNPRPPIGSVPLGISVPNNIPDTGDSDASAPVIFHPDELAAAEAKPSVAFINGQPSPVAARTAAQATPPPVHQAVSGVVSDLIGSLSHGAKSFLQGIGQNAAGAATAIATVFEELRPQLEAFVAPALAGEQGALRELGFLRDTIASSTGRITEDLLDHERIAFNAFVTSTVQSVVRSATNVVTTVLKGAVAFGA